MKLIYLSIYIIKIFIMFVYMIQYQQKWDIVRFLFEQWLASAVEYANSTSVES